MVKPFCDRCGARTIQSCENCHAQLEGDLLDSGIIAPYYAPHHCSACGAPYPWTAARIEAATELAAFLASSDDERVSLEKAVPDLLVEGPRSGLAAARWKEAIDRAGKQGVGLARDLFVGVVSAAVARQMGLS
jgi:hypothetical protein